MLKRCEDTKLALNWEKSHFMVKEGIVLGHKISRKGIEVDKAKVDVISKLPHPTTVKGIRMLVMKDLTHGAIIVLIIRFGKQGRFHIEDEELKMQLRNGTAKLSHADGSNFKVNCHRLKHYYGGDTPPLVIPDLQTFPKDN
ncbi:hypothetical protein Tco_0412347 [Tanacetum coccineum]